MFTSQFGDCSVSSFFCATSGDGARLAKANCGITYKEHALADLASQRVSLARRADKGITHRFEAFRPHTSHLSGWIRHQLEGNIKQILGIRANLSRIFRGVRPSSGAEPGERERRRGFLARLAMGNLLRPGTGRGPSKRIGQAAFPRVGWGTHEDEISRHDRIPTTSPVCRLRPPNT